VEQIEVHGRLFRRAALQGRQRVRGRNAFLDEPDIGLRPPRHPGAGDHRFGEQKAASDQGLERVAQRPEAHDLGQLAFGQGPAPVQFGNHAALAIGVATGREPVGNEAVPHLRSDSQSRRRGTLERFA